MPSNAIFNLKAIVLTLICISSQSIASNASLSSRSTAFAQEEFFLKESFQPPKQWVNQGPASGDTPLVMRISLNQPNLANLEQILNGVSDPDSPQYGCYYSKEDVLKLAAPSQEGLEAVNSWLEAQGFDLQSLQRSQSGDSVKLTTTVAKAEEMLNTSYSVYQHASTGEQLVRTSSWSVPRNLVNHIDNVHPTTTFISQTRKAIVSSTAGAADDPVLPLASIPSRYPLPIDPVCDDTTTPTCLFELYNASTYRVQRPTDGHIGVAAYIGEFANIADFNLFNMKLRPEAINSSFNVVSINGGQNNQSLSEDGSEADLDVQYAFAMSFPIQATLFTTGGSPPFTPDAKTMQNDNEPYLNWIDYMLSQENLPQTMSTSYVDDEETVPPSYARQVCNGLGLISLRGTSLLFASGDFGVGDGNPDPATTTCISNDGKNRPQFLATFPAGCPYVTAVGATVGIPETAAQSFGSGGGFSNYFAQPSYQEKVVTQYLKSIGNTYHGLFNSSGRGYPDVSAMGDNYASYFKGAGHFVGGTSAATPTFSGLVALLNDARIAAGMSPLGFLNTMIYKKGFEALNDITIGSNPGCGTPGFNCTAGWDPVTGFGTPNFGLLREFVLHQLPPGHCPSRLGSSGS